jgi:hypothetical protein
MRAPTHGLLRSTARLCGAMSASECAAFHSRRSLAGGRIMADHPGAEAIVRSVANALFNPNPQPPPQPTSPNKSLKPGSPTELNGSKAPSGNTTPGGSSDSDTESAASGRSDSEPLAADLSPIQNGVPSALARSSSLKVMERVVNLASPKAPTRENGAKVGGRLSPKAPYPLRVAASAAESSILVRQSSSVGKAISRVGRTLVTQTSKVHVALAL